MTPGAADDDAEDNLITLLHKYNFNRQDYSKDHTDEKYQIECDYTREELLLAIYYYRY